jgi:hypothetical protein
VTSDSLSNSAMLEPHAVAAESAKMTRSSNKSFIERESSGASVRNVQSPEGRPEPRPETSAASVPTQQKPRCLDRPAEWCVVWNGKKLHENAGFYFLVYGGLR